MQLALSLLSLYVYTSTIIKRYWGSVESLFIQERSSAAPDCTFMMHTRGWIRAHNTFKILIIRRERNAQQLFSFCFLYSLERERRKKAVLQYGCAPFSLSISLRQHCRESNAQCQIGSGRRDQNFLFFLCASAHRSVNQKMCINACAWMALCVKLHMHRWRRSMRMAGIRWI